MTDFTVTGQIPHRLAATDFAQPLSSIDPSCPGMEYDPVVAMTMLAEAVLLTPLNPATPAKVVDLDGRTLEPAEIGAILATPLRSGITSGTTPYDTPANNAVAMDLLSRLTVSVPHDGYPYLRRALLAQGLNELGLDAPSGIVKYRADNAVTPSAKDLLIELGKSGDDPYARSAAAFDQFFVGIGACFRPTTLGLAVVDDSDFDRFTTYLLARAESLEIAGKTSAATVTKCRDLAKVKLTDLIEPIRIRNRHDYVPEDYSFPRLICNAVREWVLNEHQHAKANDRHVRAAMYCFDLGELICAQTITFINADRHAHELPERIEKAWTNLDREIHGGSGVVSLNKLNRLDPFHARQNSAAAGVVNERKRRKNGLKRLDAKSFSPTPPPPVELAAEIVNRIRAMGEATRSENRFKSRVRSWGKENRRRPDEYDTPGRSTRIKFLHDLHYYPDTSSSMSTDDYRDAAVFSMMLAQKLNTNFYFSSHSEVLAQELLLPVKGLSLPQMSALLDAVPKVTGGNDFQVVYDYINASPERGERMNIVATDFGWSANSSSTFVHPKNLIYVPAFNRNSSYAWDAVRQNCADFIESMLPIEPDIASHILGMYGDHGGS